MTSSKRYIITEEQLDIIKSWNYGLSNVLNVIKQVRANPYNDAAIRAEVLDAIWKWLKDHDCWKSERGNYWTPVPFPGSELMQFIEALRQQGGEP